MNISGYYYHCRLIFQLRIFMPQCRGQGKGGGSTLSMSVLLWMDTGVEWPTAAYSTCLGKAWKFPSFWCSTPVSSSSLLLPRVRSKQGNLLVLLPLTPEHHEIPLVSRTFKWCWQPWPNVPNDPGSPEPLTPHWPFDHSTSPVAGREGEGHLGRRRQNKWKWNRITKELRLMCD